MSSEAVARGQRGSARVALILAGLSALTLAAAWGFEAAGYTPCELCLRERLPYEAGIALALGVALAAWRGWRGLAVAGFAVLIVVFAIGTGLGVHHAGVEWGWWPGPTQCSGAVAAPAKVSDFLHQLDSVNVVRCDQPALVILGLSLAAWNALACAVLAAGAAYGLFRDRTALGPGRSRP